MFSQMLCKSSCRQENTTESGPETDLTATAIPAIYYPPTKYIKTLIRLSARWTLCRAGRYSLWGLHCSEIAVVRVCTCPGKDLHAYIIKGSRKIVKCALR